MKNIRQSVFETNSSSTHSITITTNVKGMYDTITPDNNGIIELHGGEFGWEWQKYNDALTKANYCAVDQRNNEERLNLLKKVICEHTGAKEVVILNSDDFESPYSSYIDHQSCGTSSEAFKDEASLKNFIFNPESWLFTGNDNQTTPPNFFDVGENIKYRYVLKVEDVDLVEKFKRKPLKKEIESALDRLLSHHPACNNDDYDKRYYCINYFFKAENNKKVSSYQDLNKHIVILYKYSHDYKSFEAKICATKNVKFTLSKINKQNSKVSFKDLK